MTALDSWPLKDPDEVLDYTIDWSARLDTGETITASTWVVPPGITKDSDTFASTATVIWLSGGTAGSTYALTNRITTSDSRTMDMSVQLPVSEH